MAYNLDAYCYYILYRGEISDVWDMQAGGHSGEFSVTSTECDENWAIKIGYFDVLRID